MPRKVRGNFFILNIKIISNNEITPNTYKELFRRAHKSKQAVKSSGSNYIIFRTMFESSSEDKPLLNGKISRFTKIESDNWLDIQKMEPTTYNIPREYLPNLSETNYVFIPDAHRFVIQNKKGTVSHRAALKFLHNALNAVCATDEEVHVTLETTEDFIEKILSAKFIQSLEIEISYSNQDYTSEFEQQMDDQLRNANVRVMNLKARSKIDSSIDLGQSAFLQGSTELAGSNGTATATIINEEGRKEKVTTDQYPRKLKDDAETEELLVQKIVQQVRNVFRPN